MYKQLLNKGFKPVYYTNHDWLDATISKTRLFYNLEIKNLDIFNVILNTLNKYNELFYLLLDDKIVIQISIDENLNSFWIELFNVDADNIELTEEEMIKVLNVLPNIFQMEHSDV